MSSFESVLSWLQSDKGTAILVLLGCTVLLLSAVSGIWYIFFKMTGSEIRRNFGEFPSTKETPTAWSTWTVTAWYIEVRNSEGNLLYKEGPFYSWDKAFARCAELNAKHS